MAIITDARERAARAHEKRHALLRFLREELYTTPPTAALVMRCGERAARQTVNALERDGLVRRHRFVYMPGLPLVVLVAITEHGQGMAFDPDKNEPPSERVFEPGRFSLTYLNHTTAMQRLRLLAEQSGLVKKWLPGEMLGAGRKHEKRPDAVLLTSGGVRVAVEVERSLKSRKRYAAVLAGHVEAIQQKRWDRALWVSPTDDFAKRVRALVLSTRRARISGIDTMLSEAQLAPLSFTDYDSFLTKIKEIDNVAQA